MERKRSSEFYRILTVTFLLFLTPTGSSIPGGQSLNLPKLSKPTEKPATLYSFYDPKILIILTSCNR